MPETGRDSQGGAAQGPGALNPGVKDRGKPPNGPRSAPPWDGFLADAPLSEDERMELMRGFLAKLAHQAQQIDRALSDGDLPTLLDILHSLRGSAALYRLDEVAQSARRMECEAHRGADPAALRKAAQELLAYCRRLSLPRGGVPPGCRN